MTGSVVKSGATAQGRSKAEHAYEIIRSRIENGTYGPGFRLVLDRLAGEIGVSPVPVREAMRRLEAEGYIDFVRNQGATVRSIDAVVYAETLETLAVLEASATALSAPLLAKKEIREARKINNAMARSLDMFDTVTFDQQHHAIHELLYSACPNTYLIGLVDRERSRLRGIHSTNLDFVPDRARQEVAEHTRLLDLIEGSAAASKIEDYARAHRSRTAQRMLDRSNSSAR